MQTSFGAEIEFYWHQDIKDLYSIANSFINTFELFWSLKQEDGLNQFEIVFYPTTNYSILANEIVEIRSILSQNGASFIAKENDKNHTNSLQISVSFNKEVDEKQVASRLCHILDFEQQIIAPTQNCIERLKNSDNLLHSFLNIPKFICWGYDNRTAMVRVLNNRKIYNRDKIIIENTIFNPLTNRTQRFEYRAASSLANPCNLIQLIQYKLKLKEGEFKILEPIYNRSFDIPNLDPIIK